MKQRDQAVALLSKAEQDVYAFAGLMNDPAVADEILGFHAQQAVEKSLKALLAAKGVIFPHTHDLLPLIDLLQQAKVDFPFDTKAVLELVPYAVAFRYDEPENIRLDRNACHKLIAAMVDWGKQIVKE